MEAALGRHTVLLKLAQTVGSSARARHSCLSMPRRLDTQRWLYIGLWVLDRLFGSQTGAGQAFELLTVATHRRLDRQRVDPTSFQVAIDLLILVDPPPHLAGRAEGVARLAKPPQTVTADSLVLVSIRTFRTDGIPEYRITWQLT